MNVRNDVYDVYIEGQGGGLNALLADSQPVDFTNTRNHRGIRLDLRDVRFTQAPAVLYVIKLFVSPENASRCELIHSNKSPLDV